MTIREPELRTLTRPDGKLAYWEWKQAGSAAPLLHFAHANGFNGFTYRRLLGRLAQRVRVCAWDARGHGRSTLNRDPAGLTSWDVYQSDLIALLDSFGEPAVLVGHSMGGTVSLETTAARPDLVRALILIDPVIFPYFWLQMWGLFKNLGLGQRIPIAARAAKRRALWPDRDTLFDSYRRQAVFGGWPDAWLRDYIAGGTTDRADGRVELSCRPEWEARSFATLSHKAWARMRGVRVPVLVLCGARSDTFLPAARRRIQRVLPQARVVCVEEVGHFVPMEAAQRVQTEIEGFLADLPEMAGGPEAA